LGEKAVKLPLKEFSVVRVVCRHEYCGAVLEVPIDRLESALRSSKGACPVCGSSFLNPTGGEDFVSALAKAIKGLSSVSNRVESEFSVPEMEEVRIVHRAH
jgi:hypothetical protein